jgi:pyridoxine 5-phosphate synthase
VEDILRKMKLNINIDHVATLRQARLGVSPDPLRIALLAEIAGADGIVCHLREDRRHIQDEDVRRLRENIQTMLIFEMAHSDEIIDIALKIKPNYVTLVPEKRKELTTESGLDVVSDIEKYAKFCELMHKNAINVSFFIDPIKEQIDASVASGTDMVEIHTGDYAGAKSKSGKDGEFTKLENAVNYARTKNIEIAAGHGLDYSNIDRIVRLEGISEFSIGHSIISHSLEVGIKEAVWQMKSIITKNNL